LYFSSLVGTSARQSKETDSGSKASGLSSVGVSFESRA